jgi:hypothetical protein
MVKRVQAVWGRQNIMSAILMDDKGAFLSVLKGNSIQIIELMKFETNLCWWVESFMSESKVKIKMNRRT